MPNSRPLVQFYPVDFGGGFFFLFFFFLWQGKNKVKSLSDLDWTDELGLEIDKIIAIYFIEFYLIVHLGLGLGWTLKSLLSNSRPRPRLKSRSWLCFTPVTRTRTRRTRTTPHQNLQEGIKVQVWNLAHSLDLQK